MSYIPNRGDFIWLNFNPQTGHEQAGRRPAVILSPLAYNHKVSLAICCPITTHFKGIAFEVAIPDGINVSRVILADQVKSLDWQRRNTEFIATLPEETLTHVLAKFRMLLP